MIIEELNRLLDDAVREVFSTMLSLRAESDGFDNTLLNGGNHVAGAVGFIGRLTGVVYLYSSDTFARTMTSRLLGLAEHEIEGEEMVNDAVGEMANMVVGHVKSRLADRGMPCVLTIPSIVRGSHFSIESVSSTERRVFAFKTEVGHLIVDVLIKPAEPSTANS